MMKEKIRERLEQNDIPFSEDLPEKLQRYFELLNEWNTRMDLTAVMEPEETLDRHFVDSLVVLKTNLMQGRHSLIDVGTGAGFPGLPLALACPEMQVTLLDAQQKRLNFLEAVIQATGAGNIRLIHARAEDAARSPEYREAYDMAVARAVAPLNILCEYLLPFVRVGGIMVCWKGPGLSEELEAGKKAALLLGGVPGEPQNAGIAYRDWQHQLFKVEKVRPTGKTYPRKAGIPKKMPIGI